MRTYFAVLLLSAVASFLLTPWVRRLAFRIRAVDEPSERKIHAVLMPRLGGLAVFGGFCFPWGWFYLVDNQVSATFQNYEKLFFAMMIGATAMLALGVYDDLKGASALKKFSVQVGIAVGLYLAGYRIDTLSNPFGNPIELGWLALPISILWIVGITNAMNLLDGIDGLVTGVTASIALSLALINVLNGNIIVALLTLCLAGACLGFLPYNFAPARIFLGDTGSLFIGVVLACVGMLSLFKETTATLILVPLFLFGLPVFDTTSVMVARFRRGAPIFQADKSHVHHRLLELGLTQKQVVYALYSVTVFLGALAVWLNVKQSPQNRLLICALAAAIASFCWLTLRRWLTQPNSNHASPE